MIELYSLAELDRLSQKHKSSLRTFFILSILFVAAFAVLVIVRNEDNNTLCTVLACVVTVPYIWYSICYFTVFFKPTKNRIGMLKMYVTTNAESFQCDIKTVDTKIITVNGCEMHTITVICDGGTNRLPYERYVYLEHGKSVSLAAGQRVMLKTFDNVLVAYGEDI